MWNLDSDLTVGAIVSLALTKFISTGTDELAKGFSAQVVEKVEALSTRVWAKLRGRPRVQEVLASIKTSDQVTPDHVASIEPYLQAAMDEDSEFAQEILGLAKEIAKQAAGTHMVQKNMDQSRGWQTKVEGGTVFIGEIRMGNKARSKDTVDE